MVVIVEILQATALGLQRSHGLIEGEGQSPHGIISEGGLLEAAGLLGVHPTQTRHQGRDKLLRCLSGAGKGRISKTGSSEGGINAVLPARIIIRDLYIFFQMFV